MYSGHDSVSHNIIYGDSSYTEVRRILSLSLHSIAT